MSAASEKARHQADRMAPDAPACETPWALQLEVVEQRMARRRREIRRAWGALERQTAPLRWVRSAVVPGVLGLAGGALLMLLWRRRRPAFDAGRRARGGRTPEAAHSHAGLGAVLVAAAWPLVRQLVQPAIERATEAQLAALAERWLRPRSARAPRTAREEGGPPSSVASTAAGSPPDGQGKT